APRAGPARALRGRRQSVGGGLGQDAACLLDRAPLPAAWPDARDPAARLRRGRAAGAPTPRARRDRRGGSGPAGGRQARPVAVVQLGLDHFEGLRSGVGRPLAVLGERRVVAAAGIADPLSFAVQIRSLGAQVELLAFPDHHPYAPQDVARLVQAAAEADYVVITEKDAVKLR